MSSISEEIPEDVDDDYEIKSLKEKIAQIPSKYPSKDPNEPLDSLASSLVTSFQNNENIKNESFSIKEVSNNYENDFHEEENEVFTIKKDSEKIDSNINSKKMQSFSIKEVSNNYEDNFHESSHEENEVFTIKQDPEMIDSNINSRKMLDFNEERLSSNISGFLSNNKITSNLSFKQMKLKRNEEELNSNISDYDQNLNKDFECSIHSKTLKNSQNNSENNIHNKEQKELNNEEFKRKEKNKEKSTDSNISSQKELLSEKERKLSSNFSDFSRDIEKTDSNLSFTYSKISENDDQNSNFSFESFKSHKIPENPKEKALLLIKPNVKVNKDRPKTAKTEVKGKAIEEKPKKPIKKQVIKKKIIKKIEEKNEEEDEKDEEKPKNFIIKRLNSKENHKDLVNKIMEDYEKKEQKNKEKEADLFVFETMEKKHQNLIIDNDLPENKSKTTWNNDTKLKKFDLEAHKKHVKKTVEATQNKAEKFLQELQMKLGKNTKKVNNYMNEKKKNEEIFEQNDIEKEGDQLLPKRKDEKNKGNEMFEEENEKNQAGDQLLPSELQQKNQKDSKENSMENHKDLKENSMENQKNSKKNSKENSIENNEENSLENKEGNIEEKPIEKNEIPEDTWKYPIGTGQKSEYEKTQKVREQETKKKTTVLKKVEAEHLTTKKQKMLEIEKELRKKQKDIVNEQKKDAQIAKPIKALDKFKEKVPLDKPANIQNLAKETEKKEADTQNLKAYKSEFYDLLRQNREIKVFLKEVLKEKEKFEIKINKLKKNDKVICLPNGKFTSFGFVPTLEESCEKPKENSENTANISQNISLASEERNKALDLTIIGRIVNKIALAGLNLTQVFELLDIDGDKILTMLEISSNLPQLNLNLSKEEVSELLKQLDSNTDGIINKEEFINCLEKPLEIEQEYFQIMGNIKDIDNPLVMEERTMDISLRKRLVQEEIATQEKENMKNQIEYKEIIKKLKKYERIYNKTNRNTKEIRNENKKNLNQLIVIVEDLEGKFDKLEASYQEKMREIDENLGFLQEELVKKTEKLLEGKNLLTSQRNLFQKLQIKQITYDRISEKLKQNLDLINENEIRLNENIKTNQQIKAKRNENALKKVYFTINITFFVIKLQSFFRMKLAQNKCKLMKKTTLAAKTVILTRFRIFYAQKRGKIFKKKLFYCIKEKIRPFFQRIKEYSVYQKGIEAKDDLFKDNEIAKGDEFVPFLSPINNSSVSNKVVSSLINSNDLVPQAQEEEIEVKNIEKELEKEYLASALTIQRKFREKWNKLKLKTAKVQLNFSNLCLFCKKFGREKVVERICRKCKDSFYCFDCFEFYHKSKQTRNHMFYDIAKNAQELVETEENVKKSIEEIIQKLKGKYEKLESECEGEDKGLNGLIKLEMAENLLMDALGAGKTEYMGKMAKLVCRLCIEKSEKAAVKFKADKSRFDRKACYVNYEMMLVLLVGARENLQEKEESYEVSGSIGLGV